ncbi:MAG: TPM domain-containing protein [Lachnospiraceae bacterium]|nr:TPM domain-containing protein [Lachnospiraceae bacterium]
MQGKQKKQGRTPFARLESGRHARCAGWKMRMAFFGLLAVLLCAIVPGNAVCAAEELTETADELNGASDELSDPADGTDEAYGDADAQEQSIELAYKSDKSGKTLVVEDGENLFSDSEIRQFIESASGVLEYANVYIVTSSEENYEGYAKRLIDDTFGNGSDSTLFMINMNPRKLYIFSEGQAKKTLTKDKARTVTDNIYRQASLGAYYACAEKALRQEATLLSGGRILEPMKYIGDFFLAFMVAILLVFGQTFWLRPREKREVIAGIDEAVLAAIASGIAFSFSREEKIYDPPSSSDSGSGGGGGFSGGDSGAGGGHSF